MNVFTKSSTAAAIACLFVVPAIAAPVALNTELVHHTDASTSTATVIVEEPSPTLTATNTLSNTASLNGNAISPTGTMEFTSSKPGGLSQVCLTGSNFSETGAGVVTGVTLDYTVDSVESSGIDLSNDIEDTCVNGDSLSVQKITVHGVPAAGSYDLSLTAIGYRK